jgi:hypothetical protein
MSEKIEWSISVPIFRNSIILRQLGIAIGVPFGLLVVILLLTAKDGTYALYALYLIAALFLFTYLLIRILWRGKYDVSFIIDSKGIHCQTQQGQADKNRVLNALTVVLGLLSGKPAVAGAGILAQSRQSVLLKWSNIRKVRYASKQHVVVLRGGLTERMAVFCNADNYAQIEKLIQSKVKQ